MAWVKSTGLVLLAGLIPLVLSSAFLEDLISGQPEAALQASVDAMEDLIASITSDAAASENAVCSDAAWIDMCSETDQLSLSIVSNFSTTIPIDESKVTIKTPLEFDETVEPDDVNGLEVCASLRLLPTYMNNLDNYNSDNVLKWQYYGGQNSAIFSIYPGYEWDQGDDPDCSPNYDPRFRPWYSSGASGPKDVVIIIDRSGSMSQEGRMGLARDAAKAVLDTLSHADFYGIISFSDNAENLGGYTTLRRATSTNLDESRSLIDTIIETGSTNMADAFNAAFEMLELSRTNSESSFCHSAILFLTDGDNTGDDPLAIITERNTADIDARIFTYTLGSSASRSLPKDMACDNRGVYTHVDDNDPIGLNQAMAGYYSYFAAGRESTDVSWSEIYTFSTGGTGTSGARPVYKYDEDGNRELFGVVAIDFFESALTAGGNSTEEVNVFLRERSARQCLDLDLTEERIEALRGSEACSNTTAIVLGAIVAALLLIVCCCAFKRHRAAAAADEQSRKDRQRKADEQRAARNAQLAATSPQYGGGGYGGQYGGGYGGGYGGPPPGQPQGGYPGNLPGQMYGGGPPQGGPPPGYPGGPNSNYGGGPPPGGYMPQPPPNYPADPYDPNANTPRYQ